STLVSSFTKLGSQEPVTSPSVSFTFSTSSPLPRSPSTTASSTAPFFFGTVTTTLIRDISCPPGEDKARNPHHAEIISQTARRATPRRPPHSERPARRPAGPY